MKLPLYSILLLLLLLSAPYLKAQEFGGNPPSIKWNQVNTKPAKVIFPVGLDSAGLRVANIIQQMNKAIQPTIGLRQKQISIVLQNQTTISNAYVGLAPFRSEFYLTPEQNSFDIGSLPWTEQLAIHEFRHVQQYNNFDVGLSHVLKVLFGEGGQALGNDLAVPNWFFEGDAVFNETHVSEQGRGRLPYFFNGFRALWNDSIDYNYMKLRNGSYRDYTPDWYPLGYMLVSYGRETYGDDFWRKVTHDAAAFKGLFYPMEKGIKRYSGKDFYHFRGDAFNFYKNQFGFIPSGGYLKYLRHTKSLKPHRHFDADREYPAFINDTTLIYMKSSYDHVPVFVIKTGLKEKTVSVRDISLDNYFSYHEGQIVYSTYHPDLRWNYRDYSELAILDITTGKERHITRKTKYFAPAFSNDGKAIVTVKEGTNGKSELALLNTADGRLIAAVPNTHNLFYTYPKFYGTKSILSPVRNRRGQMAIALITISSGDVRYLTPFSYQPIAFPFIMKDSVYFSATSGIDDRLFALTINTGQIRELNNHNLSFSVGNYQPAVSDNHLAWVGFTAFGYQVNELEQSGLKWLEIDKSILSAGLPGFGIAALTRDSSTNLLASVKKVPLPVIKYSKNYHLLNFHSLIPNFNDPNYQLALEGENVLNTLQTDLLFNYNRDEGYKEFGADAVYGALFPYISAGASYTIDRREYYRGENVYWNETNIHAGLELPLNFTSGKHITYLQAGSDLYYSNAVFQQNYNTLFTNRDYTYSNSYLRFSNSTQQAKKNIYPMFGESISLDYKTAISGINATQFLASGYLYLPGFFINHSIVINVAHQQKGTGDIIDFSNDFPFSRGYTAENLHHMNKAGINYNFPIAYPDGGFANLLYLQRLRGNAFYDYTYATDVNSSGAPFKGTFNSAGAECFFDTQLFNQAQVSFGFRYSYLFDNDIFGGNGRSRFEFIVPITIF